MWGWSHNIRNIIKIWPQNITYTCSVQVKCLQWTYFNQNTNTFLNLWVNKIKIITNTTLPNGTWIWGLSWPFTLEHLLFTSNIAMTIARVHLVLISEILIVLAKQQYLSSWERKSVLWVSCATECNLNPVKASNNKSCYLLGRWTVEHAESFLVFYRSQ